MFPVRVEHVSRIFIVLTNLNDALRGMVYCWL
jgi:hypothetical protein